MLHAHDDVYYIVYLNAYSKGWLRIVINMATPFSFPIIKLPKERELPIVLYLRFTTNHQACKPQTHPHAS